MLFQLYNEPCVYKPLSAGRRHARRIAFWGLIATVATALAFLAITRDLTPSLAAFLGGMGIVVGSWLAAQIALGGRIQGAGVAFARLLAGMGTKWSVVVLALLLGVAKGLPAFPLMVGVVIATLAPLVTEIFNIRNKVS